MANVRICIEGLTISTSAPSHQADVNVELQRFDYEANDVEMADQQGILEGFTKALLTALDISKYV